MSTKLTLERIKSMPEVVEALAWPLDLDVTLREGNDAWLKLDRPIAFEVIAREGTGGLFAAYGSEALEARPILHAGSEGQSGRIADDLLGLVRLVTSMPFWMDALKFSRGGSIDAMENAYPAMKKRYEAENPDILDRCRFVRSRLGVKPLADPISYLFRCVSSSDCVAVADDGSPYGTLFGDFTFI